ncbi:MAG: secretin N-terminal domain-containing protein [Desulfobacterales bacterium]|jgi:type II secretory pathway component GspD/PulD (secretin)
MRYAFFAITSLQILALVFAGVPTAETKKTPGGRMVVCLIQLQHADAEYLASVLKPFLSQEGSLTPYKATNTLIIRDREPVANMLSEIIKGRPCTSPSQSQSD